MALSEPHTAHFPEHPETTPTFDRDITPVLVAPGRFAFRFNPRWRNGNGNPLGGVYLPASLSAAMQEMARQGKVGGRTRHLSRILTLSNRITHWNTLVPFIRLFIGLTFAIQLLFLADWQNYTLPVSHYQQFLTSAALDATCELTVKTLKAGKTMCFLLVSMFELPKPGKAKSAARKLVATAHIVLANPAEMPVGYPAHRTISQLHPVAPPKLPGHADCVDFFEAFGLTTSRPADRGFSFLCDRQLAKSVRSRSLALRNKAASQGLPASEAQEHLDLALDCHVGFICPDSPDAPRDQDWLTVALMTDCLWAVNELYAIEADPSHRFWSTTVSLAIHFFGPLPRPTTPAEKGYLLARASITHLAGGLSELEALIWDSRGERLIATGRQTCLTKRVVREPERL